MVLESEQVTVWLQRWSDGDLSSLDHLLPAVYADLRRIAVGNLRGSHGHETLQPTALINDVFVRLLGAAKVDISNRKHFFATAAKVMRQILMDRARARARDKRGGGEWHQVDFSEALALQVADSSELPALDEALSQLAVLDPRMAEMVELRYFAGLEVREVAELFEVDERTIYRDWAFARAWLKQQLA